MRAIDHPVRLFDFDLTPEQDIYFSQLRNPSKPIVFVDAPAGTGKTTLAVKAGLMSGLPITYIVAPVEEDKQGYVPGNIGQKTVPYLTPLYDAVEECGLNPDKVVARYDNDGDVTNESTALIFPISHTYVRGSNIEDRYVIVAEAQNYTTSQLKKVFTRAHDTSKLVVEGHSGQIDLPNKEMSGFERYRYHYADQKFTAICHLTVNFRGDVSRWADELKEG